MSYSLRLRVKLWPNIFLNDAKNKIQVPIPVTVHCDPQVSDRSPLG